MLEWLTPILKGIGDAKVADVLREKVGLLEIQRDQATGERDVLATKLAQAKQKIETLEAEKADLQGRVAEQAPNQSSSPFRVSDDFKFVPEGGFWIEKKTGLRVCADCILPPVKIVSPLFEGLGTGLDGEPELVWRCGRCRAEYWHESVKSRTG